MEQSAVENNSRRAVLSTLAWFDVFSYPLTAIEVVHYGQLFGQPVTLERVMEILQADSNVQHSNGYYYLTGNERHLAQRQQRFRLAGSKLKRARLVAALFGLLPTVRTVAVCNSLALANASDDSDIDLFVICRSGTVWLTRLLLAAPLIALRLRPTPINQKNKICLSFIASENALDFSGLQLEGDDPYLRVWLATLLPLYDPHNLVKCVSQGLPESGRHLTPVRGAGTLEKIAKRIQQKRFPEKIRTMANQDSRVQISDDILKFHVNDRREQYRAEFRERLRTLGI